MDQPTDQDVIIALLASPNEEGRISLAGMVDRLPRLAAKLMRPDKLLFLDEDDHYHVLRLLLEAGLDPNIVLPAHPHYPDDPRTLLGYAVYFSAPEVIKLLLRCGAQVRGYGNEAFDMAIKNQDYWMALMPTRYGARPTEWKTAQVQAMLEEVDKWYPVGGLCPCGWRKRTSVSSWVGPSWSPRRNSTCPTWLSPTQV